MNLLVGENWWADEVPQSIFNHVLHQMGPKNLLIIDQERCLDKGEKVVFKVSFKTVSKKHNQKYFIYLKRNSV